MAGVHPSVHSLTFCNAAGAALGGHLETLKRWRQEPGLKVKLKRASRSVDVRSGLQVRCLRRTPLYSSTARGERLDVLLEDGLGLPFDGSRYACSIVPPTRVKPGGARSFAWRSGRGGWKLLRWMCWEARLSCPVSKRTLLEVEKARERRALGRSVGGREDDWLLAASAFFFGRQKLTGNHQEQKPSWESVYFSLGFCMDKFLPEYMPFP